MTTRRRPRHRNQRAGLPALGWILCLSLTWGPRASAKVIPVGTGPTPIRVRTELENLSEPGRHVVENLEITRSGALFTFRWALTFEDGRVWTETAIGEVKDGGMVPRTVQRLERDGRGGVHLALEVEDLAGAVVKLRVARNGAAAEDEEIDVDDPPLYPPVMTGTLYHALFEGQTALAFSTLADYPWGLGEAPMEVRLDDHAKTSSTLLGDVPLRRVTIRPSMPWPLATMVSAIGIDTSVYLDVAEAAPHGILKYEGAYSSDSGRFRGRAVEFRVLDPGEMLDSWPPPPRPAAQPASAAEGGDVRNH